MLLPCTNDDGLAAGDVAPAHQCPSARQLGNFPEEGSRGLPGHGGPDVMHCMELSAGYAPQTRALKPDLHAPCMTIHVLVAFGTPMQ